MNKSLFFTFFSCIKIRRKRKKRKMLPLPIDMMNEILAVNGKQLYRNKYTDQLHVRFLPIMYTRFLYLFTDINYQRRGDYLAIFRNEAMILVIDHRRSLYTKSTSRDAMMFADDRRSLCTKSKSKSRDRYACLGFYEIK